MYQLPLGVLCSHITSLVTNCEEMQSCVLIAEDGTVTLKPHFSLMISLLHERKPVFNLNDW